MRVQLPPRPKIPLKGIFKFGVISYTIVMLQNFSPIQNHIISRLKNAKALRYSELQPRDVPNDLFNYHLQFLVKKGFIIKSEDGYSFSDAAIKYVADAYSGATALTSLYKLNVITIVSRVVDDQLQVLNQIRTSNPSYGKVGVMGGIVLKGETIEDAATRKLQVETGLAAFFKIVGFERRMLYRDNALFSDVLFPICYSGAVSGNLRADTEYGHNMWVPIDEAIANESKTFDCVAGIVTVLKALKDRSIETLPFFFNQTTPKGSTNN